MIPILLKMGSFDAYVHYTQIDDLCGDNDFDNTISKLRPIIDAWKEQVGYFSCRHVDRKYRQLMRTVGTAGFVCLEFSADHKFLHPSDLGKHMKPRGKVRN